MKDFQQRKMALRIAIARELIRRGVDMQTIADTCSPTQEDYDLYVAEIDAAEAEMYQHYDVDDQTVIDLEAHPPRTAEYWLISPYWAIAVLCAMLLIAVEFAIRAF